MSKMVTDNTACGRARGAGCGVGWGADGAPAMTRWSAASRSVTGAAGWACAHQLPSSGRMPRVVWSSAKKSPSDPAPTRPAPGAQWRHTTCGGRGRRGRTGGHFLRAGLFGLHARALQRPEELHLPRPRSPPLRPLPAPQPRDCAAGQWTSRSERSGCQTSTISVIRVSCTPRPRLRARAFSPGRCGRGYGCVWR